MILSSRAEERLKAAGKWLAARSPAEEIVVLAPNPHAAHLLIRRTAAAKGASFGWHRYTVNRFASVLAAPALNARGFSPVSALALEALAARVVHRLSARGELGRYSQVAEKPGLPRALTSTFSELRLAGLSPDDIRAVDLSHLYASYIEELGASRLADRKMIFELACAAIAEDNPPLIGRPLLLLDPAIRTVAEADFLAAVCMTSTSILATHPDHRGRSRGHLAGVLGIPLNLAEVAEPNATDSLARLQQQLFRDVDAEPTPLDDSVEIFSTPGESLECVEIVRRIHREAEAGTPFDKMAILLRTPGLYRGHLEEALRRGGIPGFFARGTVRPDKSGRAFLALLACKADDLSAARFAEYLSLSVVPDATADGTPPPAAPSEERWAPPDTEMVRDELADTVNGEAPDDEPMADESADDPDAAPVVSGDLRAPRRWERLLVEAAVIGGLDRWSERLDSLEEQLRLDLAELDDPDDPAGLRIERDIVLLRSLRRFAIPLLTALSALPEEATWGEWLEALSTLASRALRYPERVQATLAELDPMGEVGPVDLREVRLVLHRRLTDLVYKTGRKREGKVYVGDVEGARGLSFDVVFVPSLAERMFPARLFEDPILGDRDRNAHPALMTNVERARNERLALRLGVGAASRHLYLSYPRLDVNQSRPRVPSFYGLELLRAAEGRLPGFGELMQRAGSAQTARLGWPAPAEPRDAIDEAEHDLALLQHIFEKPDEETVGMARYLLTVNAHLTRALRFRARRWHNNWTAADGLVRPSDVAKAALAEHGLSKRSFSPTALQKYAECPYKFFLYTVLRLKPREEVSVADVMNPLQRGSMVHEVLYELLVKLREKDMLPVREFDAAHALLEETLDEANERWRAKLRPIVTRVWDDELALIKGDLSEWLRREVSEPEWVPERFELAFGLRGRRREKDPASVDDAVMLDCGIQLRGSIDLVERASSGKMRATDYKTGRVRFKKGAVVGGGSTLQPVFYALALEKIFEQAAGVEQGRLYYCTTAGGFEERVVELNNHARRAADKVAQTIGGALEDGFLPAAPGDGACRWCDYRPVCGPYEEYRTKRKPEVALEPLRVLRKLS